MKRFADVCIPDLCKLLLLIPVLMSMLTFPAEGQNRVVTVNVPALTPFDPSSGIPVTRGQQFSVTASGSWSIGDLYHRFVSNPTWQKTCGPDGYAAVHPSVSWSKSNSMMLIGKIGASYFNIGSSGTFTSPETGVLTFGHGDGTPAGGNDPSRLADNYGSMTVTVTLSPAVITTTIPGLPVLPGASKSDPMVNGITGMVVVDEDKDYTWHGVGSTLVNLAPDSRIEYEFDFGDSFAPAPFKDSFDPSGVQNINRRISGIHKYKESGASYDIRLKVQFTERTTFSDGTYSDRMVTHAAGPFKVVVVDHIPEYVGNMFCIINGPGNITDRVVKQEISDDVDVIFEDPDPSLVEHSIYALVQLYAELPPGTDTGIDADRFEGVEPASVRYSINFGDGTPDTGWLPFEVINKASPRTKEEINQQSSFHSPPFTHDYSEPGEYLMKVRVSYREVLYEEVSLGSISFTYKKRFSEVKTFVTSRKVYVLDRTPPRIMGDSFQALSSTTGDRMEVSFDVEDNNLHKDIKKGDFYLEDHLNPNTYIRSSLSIVKTGKSALKGNCYNLRGRIDTPADFANKAGVSEQPLKYYITVTDGEDNVNYSTTEIAEDTPPYYGLTENTVLLQRHETRDMTVLDNDPHSIRISFFREDTLARHIVISEEVHDDTLTDPVIFSPLTVTDVSENTTDTYPDTSVNPAAALPPDSCICLDKIRLEMPEDIRFRIDIEIQDNVDAGKGRLSVGGEFLNPVVAGTGKYRKYMVFGKSGETFLDISTEDLPNLDGTRSFRNIRLPFLINKSFLNYQSLDTKKH